MRSGLVGRRVRQRDIHHNTHTCTHTPMLSLQEEVSAKQGSLNPGSWGARCLPPCLPGHRGSGGFSPEQRIAKAGQPQDVGGTEQWWQLD